MDLSSDVTELAELVVVFLLLWRLVYKSLVDMTLNLKTPKPGTWKHRNCRYWTDEIKQQTGRALYVLPSSKLYAWCSSVIE
jgi:hypothetical protein